MAIFPRTNIKQTTGPVRTSFGSFVEPGGRVAAYVRSTGMQDGDDSYLATNLVTTLNAGLARCRAGLGDTVFVLSSFGDFAALNLEDGRIRWELNLGEAFGTKMPNFGFASSCLVDGDLVVIQAGGPEGKSYAALSRKNGEVQWTTGEAEQIGYSSPLLVEIGGTRQYVSLISNQLRSVDTEGVEIWTHPWPEGETHSMPVFIPPDKIYASGAEGVGAHLLQIEAEEGNVQVQEIWQSPFMRNHFSSSVIDGDHLYGFDNATLKCIALSDAKMAWGKRGFGKGSLILADDLLYVLSDRGQLVLAKATPDGYEETGSVQALEGRCWTSPTLSGGRLYLRNHTEMVVYDLKGQKG